MGGWAPGLTEGPSCLRRKGCSGSLVRYSFQLVCRWRAGDWLGQTKGGALGADAVLSAGRPGGGPDLPGPATIRAQRSCNWSQSTFAPEKARVTWIVYGTKGSASRSFLSSLRACCLLLLLNPCDRPGEARQSWASMRRQREWRREWDARGRRLNPTISRAYGCRGFPGCADPFGAWHTARGEEGTLWSGREPATGGSAHALPLSSPLEDPPQRFTEACSAWDPVPVCCDLLLPLPQRNQMQALPFQSRGKRG